MKIENWKLKDIKPYERNAKRHNVQWIKKSISEFKADQPIVVDGEGVIIKGHGRLKAAKELGYTDFPVIVRTDLTPEQVKMKISKKQAIYIQKSKAWLNIAHGAVRSGKSVATNYRWIEYCWHGPAGDLLMVGKTERTLRRNVINPIMEILTDSCKYNQGTGEFFIGNRRCYIVGANDERAEQKIKGLTCAGAYADEISTYPQSFFDMLLTRLSVPNSKLFGTTNPDSPYHWLKQLYLDNLDIDLFQMQFQIDDNPFLNAEFVDNMKKSFSGVFYKRNILGEWVLAEGIIYDMFSDKNIAEFKGNNKIISIDYGIANPTCFLKFEYDNYSKVVITDEYYYNYKALNIQKTDSELAEDLRIFIGTDNISVIYVDPSALSFIVELKKRGYPVKPADNDVLNGIAFCGSGFGSDKLYISASCKNLIKELQIYSWDAKAQQRGEDKPLKINDHAVDTMRYGYYTHLNKKQYVLPDLYQRRR